MSASPRRVLWGLGSAGASPPGRAWERGPEGFVGPVGGLPAGARDRPWGQPSEVPGSGREAARPLGSRAREQPRVSGVVTLSPKAWEGRRSSHLHSWASWWAATARCSAGEGIGGRGVGEHRRAARSGKGALQNRSSPLFKMSGSCGDKIRLRNWSRPRETRETGQLGLSGARPGSRTGRTTAKQNRV